MDQSEITSLRNQGASFELAMFILGAEMMVYLFFRAFDLQNDPPAEGNTPFSSC